MLSEWPLQYERKSGPGTRARRPEPGGATRALLGAAHLIPPRRPAREEYAAGAAGAPGSGPTSGRRRRRAELAVYVYVFRVCAATLGFHPRGDEHRRACRPGTACRAYPGSPRGVCICGYDCGRSARNAGSERRTCPLRVCVYGYDCGRSARNAGSERRTCPVRLRPVSPQRGVRASHVPTVYMRACTTAPGQPATRGPLVARTRPCMRPRAPASESRRIARADATHARRVGRRRRARGRRRPRDTGAGRSRGTRDPEERLPPRALGPTRTGHRGRAWAAHQPAGAARLRTRTHRVRPGEVPGGRVQHHGARRLGRGERPGDRGGAAGGTAGGRRSRGGAASRHRGDAAERLGREAGSGHRRPQPGRPRTRTTGCSGAGARAAGGQRLWTLVASRRRGS